MIWKQPIFSPETLRKFEDILNEHERQYNNNNTVWLVNTVSWNLMRLFQREIEQAEQKVLPLLPIIPYDSEPSAIALSSTEEPAGTLAPVAGTSGLLVLPPPWQVQRYAREERR
ncbi:unnamed protein product [Gongylonema pulchrum]|uniref:Inner membrane protein n=1 Tax=Gongylonema pulchrum TaxID=637853 RepID=A0A183DR34_9BILA|nr:unnamed protein product [Gongylonema pulchrum]